MAKVKVAPFDASEYLDDEEVIAEYLTAALEDPNPETFLLAVANVAKARGIAKIVQKPAKTKQVKRDLFSELTEGMKALVDARQGRRTLRNRRPKSRREI